MNFCCEYTPWWRETIRFTTLCMKPLLETTKSSCVIDYMLRTRVAPSWMQQGRVFGTTTAASILTLESLCLHCCVSYDQFSGAWSCRLLLWPLELIWLGQRTRRPVQRIDFERRVDLLNFSAIYNTGYDRWQIVFLFNLLPQTISEIMLAVLEHRICDEHRFACKSFPIDIQSWDSIKGKF